MGLSRGLRLGDRGTRGGLWCPTAAAPLSLADTAWHRRGVFYFLGPLPGVPPTGPVQPSPTPSRPDPARPAAGPRLRTRQPARPPAGWKTERFIQLDYIQVSGERKHY